MEVSTQYYGFTLLVGDEDPLVIRDRLINYEGKRSIFDLDRIICYDQIKIALARSDRAFETNSAVANNWGIEVLIHLAGDHQISNCLEVLGISENTKRIGIIQDEPVPPIGATNDFSIKSQNNELVGIYDLPGMEDPCLEVLSKGINVVINHE